MGLAMGCIGMSMCDFERCTPAEFYEVWSRWQEREQQDQRDAWEQTRMLALFMVQPWSKTRLTVQDILTFPWDNRQHPDCSIVNGDDSSNIEARFEAARKRYGLK